MRQYTIPVPYDVYTRLKKLKKELNVTWRELIQILLECYTKISQNQSKSIEKDKEIYNTVKEVKEVYNSVTLNNLKEKDFESYILLKCKGIDY